MALDAFVYCDCFEKDNLRCNPPGGLNLCISPNGDITCDAPTERDWFAFSAWKHSKACLHEGMILKHHRLGNAALIDHLKRAIEANAPNRFPILLGHILYSGTHTCDWLPMQMLPSLTEELRQLEPAKTRAFEAVQHLKIQLAELIIAAQMTKKPICF